MNKHITAEAAADIDAAFEQTLEQYPDAEILRQPLRAWLRRRTLVRSLLWLDRGSILAAQLALLALDGEQRDTRSPVLPLAARAW
jgi:hypothetical protein